MKTERKKKLKEKPLFVDDEVGELTAEIARLRGVIRAMAKIGKTNLKFTPEYMIREWK